MSFVKHVFVYGTLLSGMSSSKLLDTIGAELVENGHVSGKLYITDFPRLVVPADDGGLVHGELYRLRNVEESLSELDKFEREGELYTRSLIDVTTASYGTIVAWSYHSRLALSETDRIPSGNYRAYLRDVPSG